MGWQSRSSGDGGGGFAGCGVVWREGKGGFDLCLTLVYIIRGNGSGLVYLWAWKGGHG